VRDEQVDSYLAGLGGAPGAGAGPEDAAMKEQVRRNLLIEEYKDRVLLKGVKVEPSEVEEYFQNHPEEFRQSRVLVLRQILLDDPEEAKRVAGELKAEPAQFPVLAERYSLSPDKGQPRQFEEEDLPEEVRQAVVALSPGQISGLVGDGDKFRIFQMVDRRESKSQTLEEARRRIEVLLLQRKAEEALRQALDGMRGAAAIQVHRENLPFAYQGEYGG
jgi:parvulin-like peptidyl-prolyl isomerase